MVRVYKSKDKLVIYLPFDVIKELNISEGDDVDFFKFQDNSYIFAKKSDITNLLVGKATPLQKIDSASTPVPQVSDIEVGVLKKLDSLRYNMRTKANVLKMLSAQEKEVLKGLLDKKEVRLFAKEKGAEALFSISKEVYDKYLMRKNIAPQIPVQKVERQETKVSYRPQAGFQNSESENVKALEKNGFVVLQYEADASALSLALESSIRKGMVLGTRSFNKKFYIILRAYFDRYGSKILKALKDGEMKVVAIASEVGIDEDGARAILYLLSESGDVSEKRRDVFTLA